ncbi:MAG: glycosyltransferase family 2 protein [Lachnospiraceae bacterium]|nr:glycosyltransferase family 2 protein [Lachnospiraceae bacterium]
MEVLGEVYYHLGMKFFEGYQYEQAVENLIKAYGMGYQRENILEFLYSCYAMPNEKEFRRHYGENCAEVTQFPFDHLALDFFPVSEEKYYIFDKESREFAGAFELDGVPVHGKKAEFHSILFTGVWDIRQMIPALKDKEWETVYILLEGLEAKFLSFLKLPKFKEKYLGNVLLFSDGSLMRQFFEQYQQFYLPKELVSTEPEKYKGILQELHQKRLSGMPRERKSIFLSVCIPSYNRGMLAFENVRHFLQCPYDSEVEIIVSDNGSQTESEWYEKIKGLPDRRVRYHRFTENQGYATNVLKALELAQGKFAVLASDEDFMLLEHMGEYLSYLKANQDAGLFTENIACYPRILGRVYKAGLEAVRNAMDLNYMTGITYNMDALKKHRALEMAGEMRGNIFLENYVHIPLAAILGKSQDFHTVDLLLWAEGKAAREEPLENGRKVLSYMYPQGRVGQFLGAMEFLGRMHLEAGEFKALFLERCSRAYGLLLAGYRAVEGFRDMYAWEDTCMYVYRKEKEYLSGFPFQLSEKDREALEDSIRQIFIGALDTEMLLESLPREEAQKKRLLHQLIKMDLEGIKVGNMELAGKDSLSVWMSLEWERGERGRVPIGEISLEDIYGLRWEQIEKQGMGAAPWDT